MPERIPHDHPSVETVRATLARRGRSSRPRLALPDDADRFPLDTIRLVLDGETYHARVESGLDGDREITGAYDNARLARERDGTDRLDEWRRSSGLDLGRSVAVDIVESGFLYGVREPGERAVYEATEPPDEGLAAIAQDLDGDPDG
ncbi:DUF7112 family protein [Halococcus saccharolyticus]|uniref:Uncharacterized protein n=1 Tax=Halococcus saccharolyticus DSM 5350 TaxID=1227455 RepID=M0MEY4_9EURY|nr:hypothetical protein [Halococcus saccharolyticus]EMA43239.1 hypothetical protein C449_14712 [Halococcus saccharolyticus DSM 5350]